MIASFYELARDRKIALIIDETYKDFLGNIQPHYLFEKKQWEETFIQIYSFSKVFSLTGYRVGSCLLYTSPSPRDRSLSRMPSSA